MSFRDREEAARLLAERLDGYRGRNPLVMGVPRGGVPMARTVAGRLGGDLDVVLVRKIGAPGNPEFAIGAVDEEGRTYLSPAAADLDPGGGFVERERLVQLETLRRRGELYRRVRPAADPSGRIVILVDDGIATGATLLAAIRILRDRGAHRIVAAAGVASPDAARRVRKAADETVILELPEDFRAVGEFFEEFGPVADEEVVRILAEPVPPRAREEAPEAAAGVPGREAEPGRGR